MDIRTGARQHEDGQRRHQVAPPRRQQPTVDGDHEQGLDHGEGPEEDREQDASPLLAPGPPGTVRRTSTMSASSSTAGSAPARLLWPVDEPDGHLRSLPRGCAHREGQQRRLLHRPGAERPRLARSQVPEVGPVHPPPLRHLAGRAPGPRRPRRRTPGRPRAPRRPPARPPGRRSPAAPAASTSARARAPGPAGAAPRPRRPPRARGAAAGVGPHPTPGPLAQRAAGDEEPAVRAEHVDRERQVQRGVGPVHQRLVHGAHRLVVVAEQDDLLGVGGAGARS